MLNVSIIIVIMKLHHLLPHFTIFLTTRLKTWIERKTTAKAGLLAHVVSQQTPTVEAFHTGAYDFVRC